MLIYCLAGSKTDKRHTSMALEAHFLPFFGSRAKSLLSWTKQASGETRPWARGVFLGSKAVPRAFWADLGPWYACSLAPYLGFSLIYFLLSGETRNFPAPTRLACKHVMPCGEGPHSVLDYGSVCFIPGRWLKQASSCRNLWHGTHVIVVLGLCCVVVTVCMCVFKLPSIKLIL